MDDRMSAFDIQKDKLVVSSHMFRDTDIALAWSLLSLPVLTVLTPPESLGANSYKD